MSFVHFSCNWLNILKFLFRKYFKKVVENVRWGKTDNFLKGHILRGTLWDMGSKQILEQKSKELRLLFLTERTLPLENNNAKCGFMDS